MICVTEIDMSAYFLAIEIGGTKLQLFVGDATGKIVTRRKLKVERSRGAAGIREQVERELPALLARDRVAAAAVGFGGPVDWRTGRIAKSHQIEGWSDFDLRGWLESLINVRVTVENDANTAALGEALRGAGIDFSPVFYVTLGSGVGGGLIVDRKVYHGAAPGEAEIGHLRLDRRGTILESRCSGWAVDSRIRELAQRKPASALGRKLTESPGGEARLLTAAVTEGDPDAVRILRETAKDLAFGLSHVVHLCHPEVVVLGGGLSGVGEPLRRAVEEALPPFIMKVFRPGPRIALAALGEDAVPVGALELARRLREAANPR
jgi:glucokinase